MFRSTKFLTIIFSILLVANIPNSFSIPQEPNSIAFYGKGIVEQSSPFAGEIVRTIVNGDNGLIMHSTQNGIVVVRLAVSESEACILTISTVCFDATVTNVRNTDTHNVGDMINLTIDLENRKELISVISGPLQGSNITIDLTKTRTRDSGDFSYTLSREGGIAGISRIVTLDSSTKIMTIKNGPDESGPITLDDVIINKFKDIIMQSGFFDMTTREYPPVAGSADYFTYTLEITTKHFTNRIQWTDTSENVPEKLYEIREKLQTTVLSFLDENWTIVEPVRVAQDFAVSSPTFVFDGMKETLQVRLNSVVEISPPEYVIHAKFDSRHGGYGDRTGQIVTQAITPHLMEIVVSEGKVISAVIDGRWDEITQTPINES